MASLVSGTIGAWIDGSLVRFMPTNTLMSWAEIIDDSRVASEILSRFPSNYSPAPPDDNRIRRWFKSMLAESSSEHQRVLALGLCDKVDKYLSPIKEVCDCYWRSDVNQRKLILAILGSAIKRTAPELTATEIAAIETVFLAALRGEPDGSVFTQCVAIGNSEDVAKRCPAVMLMLDDLASKHPDRVVRSIADAAIRRINGK